MKVFLDDLRPLPDGFDVLVRTPDACEILLRTGKVTSISLDHDLGEDCKSGYDIACLIENGAVDGWLPRLQWDVHSANPIGAKRIRAALKSADAYWDDWPNRKLS